MSGGRGGDICVTLRATIVACLWGGLFLSSLPAAAQTLPPAVIPPASPPEPAAPPPEGAPLVPAPLAPLPTPEPVAPDAIDDDERPPLAPIEVVATRPLAELSLDWRPLAKLGTRHYSLFAYKPTRRPVHSGVVIETRPVNVGVVALRTAVSPQGMVFRDTWWDLRGRRMPCDFEIAYPAGDFLAPRRLTLLSSLKSTSDLTRGSYSVGWRGYRHVGEWPANTLTLPALVRLVSVLPREPGVAYTFDHFTSVPQIEIWDNVDPIVCLGPSRAKIFGRPQMETKFAWGDVLLWIRDCDGALVRLHRPGFVTLDLRAGRERNPECCRPVSPVDLDPLPVPPGLFPLPTPAPAPPAAPVPAPAREG